MSTPPNSSPPPPKRTSSDVKRGASNYAKYSGLAFQMIVPLLIGVYGGRWLDANYGDGGGTYTLIGSLLGVALCIYLPLRAVLSDDKQG